MKLPGTATQPENIHIAMGKLQIEPGMTFLDVGCGSGAVSLAASRFTRRIFGIDLRPEAVEAAAALVPEGCFLCGEVLNLLPSLPQIDRFFIGGTRGIEAFLPNLVDKGTPGSVIVANLARLGIAYKVVELMKELGIYQELLMIEIHRGHELAGDLALRPQNPIFMVVGRCGKEGSLC
jgi:cobalt-precorrin-6B (C15)-methyltransferase